MLSFEAIMFIEPSAFADPILSVFPSPEIIEILPLLVVANSDSI